MRRLARLIALPIAAAFALLAAGFLWFLVITAQAPAPLPAHADGIVALTGGPGRVEAGLHLLVEGRADRLLITGIGGHTDLAALGRLAGLDLAALADRITLGRYAVSTRGNGVETAAWAQANGIKSLIVVTAAFHKPRALAELRADVPNVTLLPYPVHPTEQKPLAQTGRLRQEIEEYGKYLFTISGLAALLPRRETIPMLTAHEGTAG